MEITPHLGVEQGNQYNQVLILNELGDLGDPEYERPIFKVHDILRNVNKRAYEPEIISIGPYHRGKRRLRTMEKHKLRYLNQLFDGKVREDRGDKGHCEKIKETICKNFLQQLGELAEEARKKLAVFACHFFRDAFHGLKVPETGFQANHTEHLLDFIHSSWNPPPLSAAIVTVPPDSKESSINRRFLSAKRMIENGVVFKISKTRGNLFDIKFSEKCCMKFSKLIFQQLIIEGRTETFFRNFIAYEQYFKASKGDFVTNYVNFFGNLIDSEEDVELLSYHGIIDNKLGHSKSVVDLFTKINQCVTIENPDKSNSLYSHIYTQLNVYCTKRRNYWKANLWESYCNPWGIASITLATLGICLALIMLAFAVLNYKYVTNPTK
nr:UPF0481 protein At3g47200-like [Ipomoea batatas]